MAGAEAEGRRESEAEAEDERVSEAEGVPLTVAFSESSLARVTVWSKVGSIICPKCSLLFSSNEKGSTSFAFF